jgi:SAM-dependent methyltransferase
MRHQIQDSDYTFDITRRIWVRADYHGICYSDGDQVEQRLAEIINDARDLTVLSAELASHCKDWPSLYHLSRRRANLLRPLENYLQNANVLEVGAGCGAMSRYLGEVGAQLLALEGSPYRASIAASRCRDLVNVTVVAEAFHLFEPVQRFDVVTLIGVLEYARKFFPSSGGDPVDAMLARARNFLKPGGKLIIAIENQLGLKYFAGFPEDHTGTCMFGIEEHYSADGVVTFGRKELGKRVEKAGLTVQQWWYPFPDYKLPSLILSEAGASSQDDIDLTPIIRSACIADPQYPPSISFSPERALRPVMRNQLMSELSNSFLLLASDANLCPDALPLAIHYATDRLPEFAKKVVFKRAIKGATLAHQVALCPSAIPCASSKIRQQLVDQPYICGELWQDRLIQIITSPGWTIEQIQEWAKTWFSAFCALAGVRNSQEITDKEVAGSYLDAVPRNMFLDKGCKPIFIDQEWLLTEERSIGYISFRALLTSFASIRTVAKPFDDRYLRVSDLFTCVLQAINIDLNEFRISTYLDFERELDQLVTGKQAINNEELTLWFASLTLHVFDTQTPLHQRLVQREEQLAVTNRALAERDARLDSILNSTSWRVTRPLRGLRDWFDIK